MIEYIEHAKLGKVRVSKRRGSNSIRISVTQMGEVRLSMPYRMSLQDGLKYLEEKQQWVAKHTKEVTYLENGARIGKAHTLKVLPTTKTRTRAIVTDTTLLVYIPEDYTADQVQEKLESECKKLLLKQAKSLLPQQLTAYAKMHGYSVKSVDVNALQSRWGSCSHHNDIVLNLYLMQLPWRLIDYVILHELAHTKYHDHSKEFWNEVALHLPDYKSRRLQLKKYPTSVFDMRLQETFVS